MARTGARVLVVNAMGRVFMDQMDDPFAAIDRELAACPLREQADAVVIDFHAEASSEKQAFAHHVDGRATLVVGTHTHVPTSDYRIMPGGTAYQTDVGMCGDYDSVIGMDKEEPLRRFIRKTPGERFSPADGPATICGLAVEVDDGDRTGDGGGAAPARRRAVGGRAAVLALTAVRRLEDREGALTIAAPVAERRRTRGSQVPGIRPCRHRCRSSFREGADL